VALFAYAPHEVFKLTNERVLEGLTSVFLPFGAANLFESTSQRCLHLTNQVKHGAKSIVYGEGICMSGLKQPSDHRLRELPWYLGKRLSSALDHGESLVAHIATLAGSILPVNDRSELGSHVLADNLNEFFFVASPRPSAA
jgi:hypothetical protein